MLRACLMEKTMENSNGNAGENSSMCIHCRWLQVDTLSLSHSLCVLCTCTCSRCRLIELRAETGNVEVVAEVERNAFVCVCT